MASPHIPFQRFLTLTVLASLPPVAVFCALAATGKLSWGLAIVSAAVSVAGLGWMVRRGLSDVYRVLQFSEILAREGTASLPAREMTGLFPEFTEAVTRLQDAWGRDRGRLGARASSAETILEGLPHPLILLDAEREIVRATVGARDLLGAVTPGRDLSSALRNPQVLEAADRVLGGGGRELIEFDIQFPASRALNAQIERLPSPAADGSAAVIALFDVTEIKQVHQMRADFVANASHELRTPLSVLSGCVKTLRGPAKDDPEGREKFLGMMETHASRMTQLIEDLLSLSRIELNENMPPADRVQLTRVIANVVTALEIPAAERGIEVAVEPGLGAHDVQGDESEITQLFRNLVENAIKYSNEGATIRIVLTEGTGPAPAPMKRDARHVEIAITDEGPGIPAEHIPRLTERFYRVDTARSREMGGTGLGLAIVKHIVGRHRGALSIESALGKGSTFTVHLPLKLDPVPAAVADR